jgi:type III restriction enzyme
LGSFGRWAFAEFTEVYQIESDFNARIREEFGGMIDTSIGKAFSSNLEAENDFSE